MTNWQSLVASVTAIIAAVLSVVWPGTSIPSSVQDSLIAIAGLLTLAHVHIPKVLANLGNSSKTLNVKVGKGNQ